MKQSPDKSDFSDARLLAVRGDVAKVLEQARAEKTIGHSLDAKVELSATGDLGQLLNGDAEQLAGDVRFVAVKDISGVGVDRVRIRRQKHRLGIQQFSVQQDVIVVDPGSLKALVHGESRNTSHGVQKRFNAMEVVKFIANL